jgi:hypothetical protein
MKRAAALLALAAFVGCWNFPLDFPFIRTKNLFWTNPTREPTVLVVRVVDAHSEPIEAVRVVVEGASGRGKFRRADWAKSGSRCHPGTTRSS